MSRGETIELFLGLVLGAIGASHYIGWGPVLLILAASMIIGPLVKAGYRWWRRR